jgi:hypothetical protein
MQEAVTKIGSNFLRIMGMTRLNESGTFGDRVCPDQTAWPRNR